MPTGFTTLCWKFGKTVILLFTKSFNSGVLPSEWRRTHITPVFKKGSKVSLENYRPVSLTSHVVKVLETLVRSKALKFLDKNEIILLIVNMVLLRKSPAFCQLLRTGLVQLIKALESMSHIWTLVKLLIWYPTRDFFESWLIMPNYGFGDKLLSWLKGFLSDHYQRVVLNESSSSWCSVMSDVPQGSARFWGHCCLHYYINEIANIVHAITLVSLLMIPMFIQWSGHLRTLLQADLDNIQNWCQIWLLKLNLLKCKIMYVGTPSTTSEYKLYDTSVGQCVLSTFTPVCHAGSSKDLIAIYTPELVEKTLTRPVQYSI